MISSAVALVTGGCSGLGAAAVKCLARKGVRVLVADLPHQEELFHPNIVTPLMSESGVTKYDTGKIGEKITFHATDITDPLQVSAALDEAERVFGEPINVAVNCAGMALAIKTLSSKGPLPHPIEAFAKTLQVNTIGTFLVSTLAAERMSRRVAGADGQRGCIIQTSSIAAYEGQIGQVAYAASKAAVVGMTLPMARDLAPWGIRVVTVVSYHVSRATRIMHEPIHPLFFFSLSRIYYFWRWRRFGCLLTMYIIDLGLILSS